MKEQLKTEWAKHQAYLQEHARKQKEKETLDSSQHPDEDFMNELEFDYDHENYLMKQRSK